MLGGIRDTFDQMSETVEIMTKPGNKLHLEWIEVDGYKYAEIVADSGVQKARAELPIGWLDDPRLWKIEAGGTRVFDEESAQLMITQHFNETDRYLRRTNEGVSQAFRRGFVANRYVDQPEIGQAILRLDRDLNNTPRFVNEIEAQIAARPELKKYVGIDGPAHLPYELVANGNVKPLAPINGRAVSQVTLRNGFGVVFDNQTGQVVRTIWP